jgi:hypothetical protein
MDLEIGGRAARDEQTESQENELQFGWEHFHRGIVTAAGFLASSFNQV